MKVAVAQVRSSCGPVNQNIARHVLWSERAAAAGAGFVLFPELSLTGYDPSLADQFAVTDSDSCFSELQLLSNQQGIMIAAGVPLRRENGLEVTMLIFRPGKETLQYAKQHLHADELATFAPGRGSLTTLNLGVAIAPAICYEITVPEHAVNAKQAAADIYAASVAKTVNGAKRASQRLQQVALDHSMFTLMSNTIGPIERLTGGGASAIWNRRGVQLSQLNDQDEGILVLDTKTELVTKWIEQEQRHTTS